MSYCHGLVHQIMAYLDSSSLKLALLLLKFIKGSPSNTPYHT